MPSSSAQYSVGMPVAGKVLCGLLAASSVVGRIAIPDDIAVKELAANRQLLDSPDPIDEDEDGDAVYIDNSYDDLDGNGIPDAEEDVNGNGVPDGEEDLDGNGVPDGEEDLSGDDEDGGDEDGGDEDGDDEDGGDEDGGDEEGDPYAEDGGEEEDPDAEDGGGEEEDPDAEDGGDEDDPDADEDGGEEDDADADGGDEEDPYADDGGDDEADADADDDAMPDETLDEEVVEVMPTDDITTTTVVDFPPTPSGEAPVPDEAALAALDPPYIVGVDVEIAPPAAGVMDLGSGINVPTANDCALACSATPDCNGASWLGANPDFQNPDNCFLKIVEPGCIVPENAVVMPNTFLLIQAPEGCVTGSVSIAGDPSNEVVTGAGLAPFGATTDAAGPMGAAAPGAVDPMMAAMAPTPAAAAGEAPTPAATRDADAGVDADADTSTTGGTAGATTSVGTVDDSSSAASVGVAAFTAIAFGAVLAF